jgi:thymidylate synthase (FAD)
MKIIKPSFEILDDCSGEMIFKKLELCGRVCYKSEEKINNESSKIFIQNILQSGHESVLEHEKISVRVICDRGVTHEIVRHRIASYSQESTRYCNYSKDKFGNELTFIEPCFWNDNLESDQLKRRIWIESLQQIENSYFKLLESGATPQEARGILPNSLKTEIIITMNIREWRHFFKLRTSEKAHPQMREISKVILKEFITRYSILFLDLK